MSKEKRYKHLKSIGEEELKCEIFKTSRKMERQQKCIQSMYKKKKLKKKLWDEGTKKETTLLNKPNLQPYYNEKKSNQAES